MASKTLTAKVSFDTSSAEAKLKRLNNLINNINKAVTSGAKGSKLESSLAKQVIQAEKVKQATLKTGLAQQKVNEATVKTQLAEQRLALQTERTKAGIERIKATQEKCANSAKTIETSIKNWATGARSTNSVLGSVWQKLRGIAATYLGIMGMKAMVSTSDTITGTQNKLNNLNGGNTDLTQNQMDKMYASANKVRMEYTDMASNASKAMTLAGDAFQGNIDNAIRFQEIMAETYALGGASDAEKSSSMYQMIQALGAGTLAGDELRSVREGAPLAYQAIEKYVQGVMAQSDATKDYASKSLKDIAADGLVTSEMVVAAVMNAGSQIDKQFDKTAMTFGQAWTRIKNAAIKAFEPISNMLNKMLNDAAKNGAFEKIENAFWKLSQVLQVIFQKIYEAVCWIVDNWNWLKHVIIGALILMISYYLLKLGVAIYCTTQEIIQWVLLNSQMLVTLGTIAIIIAAVLALLYVFILWKIGAIDTCQAIVSALLIVGIAVALIGLLIGNWIVVIIGLVIAAIGLIVQYLDYFLAILYSVVSVIWNLIVTLVIKIIKDAVLPLTTAWDNFANFFGNLFNDPIAAIIRCFENLADCVLSILQTIANGIDAIFGSNLASAVQGWREGLSSKADELVEKYGNGTYEEKSNATDKVEEILNSVQNSLLWDTSDAWNTGMEHGASAKEWLSGLGSGLQTGFDDILGLNFDEMMGGFANANDDAYNVGNAYSAPNYEDLLGDIADNTGSMADSMELTQEDLEYLRRIADMEWKKEFTTASITVDMSNYNTISGENDLDGIVEKLADKLYDEMNAVANGVYE